MTADARNDDLFASGPNTTALVVDVHTRRVSFDGRVVRLTRTECSLLVALLDREDAGLSRDHALALVWGPGFRGCRRAVDVYISRLRTKLRGGVQLQTMWGVGYRAIRRGGGVAHA